MNFYDIKDEEEWQRILDHLSELINMPAFLVAPDGVAFQESGRRPELCEAIRDNKQLKKEICVKTKEFLARDAKERRKPVIVPCEAKMFKCFIPLFSKQEFMGGIFMCGAAMPTEEKPPVMIAESIKRSQEEVNRLLRKVPVVEMVKLSEVSNGVFEEINSDS